MITDFTFTLWFDRLCQRYKLRPKPDYVTWLKGELDQFGMEGREFERITRQLLGTELLLRGNPGPSWWTSRMDHKPQTVHAGAFHTDTKGRVTFHPGEQQLEPTGPPCTEAETGYYAALAKCAAEGLPLMPVLRAQAMRQLQSMTKRPMTADERDYCRVLSNLIDRGVQEAGIGVAS